MRALASGFRVAAAFRCEDSYSTSNAVFSSFGEVRMARYRIVDTVHQ
jgi:hypothetical protein